MINFVPKGNLISKEEAIKRLAAWDYVTLELGSYHRFIYKQWHEYFVKNGLVKQNRYKQFVPIMQNLNRCNEWLTLYKAWMDAREFPDIYQLTPDQAKQIREANLFGADYKYNEWVKKREAERQQGLDIKS